MEFDSAIRGHHIYKEIWSPVVGEELQCKMEHGNIHDIYAVAVTREDMYSCWALAKKHISCVVNGVRRFSADLVQGGFLASVCFNAFSTLELAEAIEPLGIASARGPLASGKHSRQFLESHCFNLRYLSNAI